MSKSRGIDLGEGRHLRVLEGDSFVDPANGKSLTGKTLVFFFFAALPALT